MNLIHELIESGKSVKSFREAILEASRNFAPGSLADLVFNFYKALRQYYSDLLTYQFQLYSDLPDYILGINSIKVTIGKEVKFFVFSKGKGKNLSTLQSLNDISFDKVSEIEYTFELAPEITNLVQGIENNTNKDLFTKTREISVGKGDGTYITGNFIPEWKNNTLVLTCTGVVHNPTVSYKVYSIMGGGL